MSNLFKQAAFGLDLSDLSIKIARLKKEREGIVLAGYGREEIPEGVIVNGEIKSEDSLVSAIQKSLKSIKGLSLKTNQCVVSLPEVEAFVRVIQLPQMKEKELGEAIKWETENYIPFPIDEVYFDWQIVQPIKQTSGHCDVLVGALNKKLVDSYLAVLKKAGLQPLVFEIESIATARALIKDTFSFNPLIIIDIGAKRSSFIIFSGRTIHFTSSLPIANDYFVQEISKHLKISREQAKEMKIQYGLSREKGIYEALQPAINELVGQIKKYIDFCREHCLPGHYENKEVSKIVLCGGGANFAGLSDFLSQELKIAVEIGNPWINLLSKQPQDVPELPYELSIGYATALGLALRGLEMPGNNLIGSSL